MSFCVQNIVVKLSCKDPILDKFVFDSKIAKSAFAVVQKILIFLV